MTARLALPPGRNDADRYGFNLLGETVCCIDCEAGGPLWRWPERNRRRHARRHRTPVQMRATGRRRQRFLLGAPPIGNHEGKEATA
jgi:hypothetical protein